MIDDFRVVLDEPECNAGPLAFPRGCPSQRFKPWSLHVMAAYDAEQIVHVGRQAPSKVTIGASDRLNPYGASQQRLFLKGKS